MRNERRASRCGQAPVLAVVALGGALGASARYGVSVWLPSPAGTFPWSTFTINVSGCLLIGVLMVLISEVWSAHRLLRPLLDPGVLGGYTTFSTYTVDAPVLFDGGHTGFGLIYLGVTLVCALVAVWVGALLTRWATVR
ncbi:MAG: fluoride efflux transporter CrcB [Actinomycetota bacterium]|nr:fluoride efflux transporter CrcB [Actinomycetota bacterium]